MSAAYADKSECVRQPYCPTCGSRRIIACLTTLNGTRPPFISEYVCQGCGRSTAEPGDWPSEPIPGAAKEGSS